MSPWVVLIIIIFIIFVIWWALLRNAGSYKPDFPVHHDESHAEHGEAEQSFGEAATHGMDGHNHVEVHDVAGGLAHKEAGLADVRVGDNAGDPDHSSYAVTSETRSEAQAGAAEADPAARDYTSADLVRDDVDPHLGEAGGRKSAVIEKGTADLAEPAPVSETPVEKFEVDQDVSGATAPQEASPETQPDDLIIIEGIGPKINQLLQSAGIITFAQLAETSPQQLREILEASRLDFIDPASWPEQARLAGEGKMDELKTLQNSLRGGRST